MSDRGLYQGLYMSRKAEDGVSAYPDQKFAPSELFVGLALTALAGWVDAIGFLRLGGLYPSFMSGNTTQLGIALGTHDWTAVGLPALLIALFVAGAFAGALIGGLATRWCLVWCFTLEALLLVAAFLLSLAQSQPVLAIAPLPLAMGLQNVTALQFARRGVGVTYVTGSLVALGEGLADAVRGNTTRWPRPCLTWLAMGVGAIGGATAHVIAASAALAVPAACSVMAAVLAAATTARVTER